MWWGEEWLLQTLPRPAVKLVFWSREKKRLCCPDYELYNRVYSFLYLFCRKVTFCNHGMYVIKLFIKVNILHNKRFLNTCVYISIDSIRANIPARLNLGEIHVPGAWGESIYSQKRNGENSQLTVGWRGSSIRVQGGSPTLRVGAETLLDVWLLT